MKVKYNSFIKNKSLTKDVCIFLLIMVSISNELCSFCYLILVLVFGKVENHVFQNVQLSLSQNYPEHLVQFCSKSSKTYIPVPVLFFNVDRTIFLTTLSNFGLGVFSNVPVELQ